MQSVPGSKITWGAKCSSAKFFHNVRYNGSEKLFEGPEFETMTSNQLMAPQYLPNLVKGGKSKN